MAICAEKRCKTYKRVLVVSALREEINLTLTEFLDRGLEILERVESADAAELKQLCEEWRGYRQHFLDLASEAEVRARLDLINFYEGVASAVDLAIIKRRKK